ncbi:MAG: hypothetical protein ABI318_02080, partial [Chthoniobacteraceae bacterium]
MAAITGTPFTVTVDPTVIIPTWFMIPTSCTAASTDNTGSIVGPNTMTVAATGVSNVSYIQVAASNMLTVNTGGPQTNVTVPGTAVNISSIAIANPCTVTTASAHNLGFTELVTIARIADGTFSIGINGTFTPAVTSATTFTVPVNCAVAQTAGTGNTTEVIRSKVYLMFLSQMNVSVAAQPTDGVFEVQTTSGSSSFTDQMPETLARNGNVSVQYNTNVNDNLQVGDHVWVDVPVVNTPVNDAEYAVA